MVPIMCPEGVATISHCPSPTRLPKVCSQFTCNEQAVQALALPGLSVRTCALKRVVTRRPVPLVPQRQNKTEQVQLQALQTGISNPSRRHPHCAPLPATRSGNPPLKPDRLRSPFTHSQSARFACPGRCPYPPAPHHSPHHRTSLCSRPPAGPASP